jgi:hypothetical protein
MDKNDGGSVFPGIPNPNAAWNVCAPGMTLRQYYAAKAMQTLIYRLHQQYTYIQLIVEAYRMADGMLAFEAQEREGQK